MALFEHQPYTNFENINLDMILADIKIIKENEQSLDNRVDALEASYTVINESITNIQTDITNIYEQIGEIDITELESRMDAVEADCLVLHGMVNNTLARIMNDETQIEANTGNIDTNNLASVNRDNALSARISALERATVHDIYNYYSDGNQLLFGGDLKDLPDACLVGGYPYSYGNKTDRAFGTGNDERNFIYTSEGFAINPSAPDSYDYYQFGRVPEYFGNRTFTLTLALAGSDGNVTPAWYQHTFADYSAGWDIATGCLIQLANADSTLEPEFAGMRKLLFKGTKSNWSSFLDGRKIIFAYLEYGEGSVDTTATYKPLYEGKDRLFFTGVPEPTPAQPSVAQLANRNKELDAYYIDAVGEPVSYKLPIANAFVTIWFDPTEKLITGYIALAVKPTSQASVSQLDGLTEKGCFVDGYIDLPLPSENPVNKICTMRSNDVRTYDASTFDMEKNINLQGSFIMQASDSVANRLHIKIQSSGFSIAGNSMAIGSIPIQLYRA